MGRDVCACSLDTQFSQKQHPQLPATGTKPSCSKESADGVEGHQRCDCLAVIFWSLVSPYFELMGFPAVIAEARPVGLVPADWLERCAWPWLRFISSVTWLQCCTVGLPVIAVACLRLGRLPPHIPGDYGITTSLVCIVGERSESLAYRIWLIAVVKFPRCSSC